MLYDTLVAGARRDDGLDPVRLAALERARWILDLLDRGAEGDRDDTTPASGGRRRCERVDEPIRSEFVRRLPDLADAEGRALLLCLMLTLPEDDRILWSAYRDIAALGERVRGWSLGEAAVLLDCAAEAAGGSWFENALGLALTAAERLGADELGELAPGLLRASAEFAGADVAAGYHDSLAGRLWALLEILDEAHVPAGMVPAHGTWAAALRDLVNAAPSVGTARFIRHLRGLSAPRPPQRWSRTCVALADAASAREAAAECLRALAAGDLRLHGGFVHQNHGDLARGAVWAATLTGGAETVPRLGALAAARSGGLYPTDLKLAGAALNALGEIDDPRALAELWRLRAEIRNRALRKQLDTALQAAAGRQGITPAQLVERTVPTHGLRPDGSLERTLGEYTVRLAIEDAATVRITFTGPDGRASRTAPAAVKDGFPDDLRRLRALAKEVRGTLSSERARVEAMMSDERVWSYRDWCEYYRDHPVTGRITETLIWEFQDEGGEWRAALGAPEGRPARVRLWHPIRATVEEIRAWRARVMDGRVRQPFKQAFREIYLLTLAEKETETYSDRFAAHIVRYRQLYALFRERRWQANHLGRHQSGVSGEARGEFGGGEWRACFHHHPAEEDFDHAPEHAATDRIRFERREGRRWREAPLADVPPPVFSEAMRDADLFVGVTSIAVDPEWTDRGAGRHTAYWRTAAFGDLTANAEVRRAALERVLPRTRLAGRCSIDGRYLVVRGELRTYRIHLGSANVLMEPDDSYLCIVQGRSSGKPFLPFEDERLSLILSKAFLLAADHRITDETILNQIEPPTTRP